EIWPPTSLWPGFATSWPLEALKKCLHVHGCPDPKYVGWEQPVAHGDRRHADIGGPADGRLLHAPSVAGHSHCDDAGDRFCAVYDHAFRHHHRYRPAPAPRSAMAPA